MYKVKDYISIDKEILGGNPLFKGTRVPVETLFLHLEKGVPLDEFLQDFPSVTKDQANCSHRNRQQNFDVKEHRKNL